MSKQGRLSRQSTIRLRAGDLIERGFDNEEIVEILEVSHTSVKRWRKKVDEGGLASLARKHGTGRFCALTQEQLAELKNSILKGARAAGYQVDRWTSRIVSDFIDKKWSLTYSTSNVRYILNRLGLSYQKPAVQSTKHSQEVVDHWRKHDWVRIKKSR